MYGNNIGQLSIQKMNTANQLVGNRLWAYPSKYIVFAFGEYGKSVGRHKSVDLS